MPPQGKHCTEASASGTQGVLGGYDNRQKASLTALMRSVGITLSILGSLADTFEDMHSIKGRQVDMNHFPLVYPHWSSF